ncbi:hypothetical protein SMICM304S_00187 [Streptomyces microflavus]
MDSDAVGPGVRSANKANMPVIAADRGVNKADTATLVASDNVAGGRLAADALADKLGGKGSIVILQGTAGTSASRERRAGFAEGLKAYPDIKVVAKQPADFDRTKGLDVMTNLVQLSPPGHHRCLRRERRDGARRGQGARQPRRARPCRSSASTAPRTV